jgi:putative N6-adenine-specific DNA methylase
LGITEVEPAYLGVYATLSEEQLWRVNTYARLANRVLIPIAEFMASTRGELYEGVKRVRWDWWVHTSQTISVDASSAMSELSHTHFIAQVVKDGVVDQLRERFEERPSVDTRSPDLPINARLHENLCTLSLDASGARLHRRGYRQEAGEAPLKETLASLLNHLAGWRPHEPLIDLTCGSGTLIIEAALRGARRPPNFKRAEASLKPHEALAQLEDFGPEPFAFSRWLSHTPLRFSEWLERAPRPEPLPIHVWGSDMSKRQVARARRNAERAGVSELCVWREGDFRVVAPEASAWAREVVASRRASAKEAQKEGQKEGQQATERLGVLLMNPPYGERLGDKKELVRFYRDLGATLKEHFKGFEAWMIVEEGSPWKEVGLKPASRLPLKNGALSCLLVQLPLY